MTHPTVTEEQRMQWRDEAEKNRVIVTLCDALEAAESKCSVLTESLKATEWMLEQDRQQLAAANERVRELTTLLDQELGTPCEQIRQQQSIEDRIARAICQETCAFKGEMPCWQLDGEFPPKTCDEPGCLYLARATISALATKEQS